MAKIPFIPIDLPPGVVRNGTIYSIKGRWYDANQVRWIDGICQPTGGWAAITTAAIAHPARGMISWTTNVNARYYALGTSTQLIVGDGTSSTWDITPTGFTAGADNGQEQLGYGGDNYSAGTYGTPRSSGVYVPPMTWTMDLWGDNLVACAAGDGNLYQWALATGTPAAVITNAPTSNAAVLVSDQQHLFALGAGGNRRLVQWSDVDNNTTWTPSTTNEAGQLPLVTSGYIMNGCRVRGQQILVLTNIDAFCFTYLGQPLIWSRQKVGDACGLISPRALATAGGIAYWMSDKRFWMFDGSSVQEVPCDVSSFLFGEGGAPGNINQAQASKIYAGVNGAFKEITWFYPSVNSTECDSYVSLNYGASGPYWMIGKRNITSWVDKGAFPTPMSVQTDGFVYNEETGTLANGSTRVGSVYATSSALEPQGMTRGMGSPYATGGGDRITEVNQILTDEKTLGDTQLLFAARYTPNGQAFNWGPFNVRSDGYMDTRMSGRQLVMTVQPVTDNAWQLGQMRWDARATSAR